MQIKYANKIVTNWKSEDKQPSLLAVKPGFGKSRTAALAAITLCSIQMGKDDNKYVVVTTKRNALEDVWKDERAFWVEKGVPIGFAKFNDDDFEPDNYVNRITFVFCTYDQFRVYYQTILDSDHLAGIIIDEIHDSNRNMATVTWQTFMLALGPKQNIFRIGLTGSVMRDVKDLVAQTAVLKSHFYYEKKTFPEWNKKSMQGALLKQYFPFEQKNKMSLQVLTKSELEGALLLSDFQTNQDAWKKRVYDIIVGEAGTIEESASTEPALYKQDIYLPLMAEGCNRLEELIRSLRTYGSEISLTTVSTLNTMRMVYSDEFIPLKDVRDQEGELRAQHKENNNFGDLFQTLLSASPESALYPTSLPQKLGRKYC